MAWDLNPFRKKSKKQRKRATLEQNRQKGKTGETLFKMNHAFEDIERTGRGHDFKIKRRDIFTGKTTTTYYEVKTGKSELSKLQEKTKRKKKNYKVERYDPPFF